MEESLKRGFMAVFAVSGSVVFLAMQVHKRLLSDFINKIEFEIKTSTVDHEVKKKVRFADDVAESTVKKACEDNHHPSTPCRNINNDESFEAIPQNWQVLYRGILQRRRV